MLAALLVVCFLASFAGGALPAMEGLVDRLGRPRVLAFRSGLLIAVAAGDVLPEAWLLAPLPALAAVAVALALGFFLHGDGDDHAGHEHSHPHLHPGGTALPAAVAALFVHSLLDGVNLGAAAAAGDAALAAVGGAVALHKLADGFTLVSLFSPSSRSRAQVMGLLAAMSLATPFGAVFSRAGELMLGPNLAAILLGFAGGSFLYVGAADALAWLRGRRDAGSALSFGGGLAAMLLLRRLHH